MYIYYSVVVTCRSFPMGLKLTCTFEINYYTWGAFYILNGASDILILQRCGCVFYVSKDTF